MEVAEFATRVRMLPASLTVFSNSCSSGDSDGKLRLGVASNGLANRSGSASVNSSAEALNASEK